MINYKKSNSEAIESIDLYFDSGEATLGTYTVFLDAACSKQPEDVFKIKDIILNKNINLIDIHDSDLDIGSLSAFKPICVKYLSLSNAIGIDILVPGKESLNVLKLRLNSVPSGELPSPSSDPAVGGAEEDPEEGEK